MPNWYIKHNEKEIGPVSSDQLKKLAAEGRINSETEVKTDSSAWSKASKVKGLFTQVATTKNEVIVAQKQQVVATYTEQPQPETKPCPFCGEQIALTAVKCRFCNEFLDPALRAKPAPLVMPAQRIEVSPVVQTIVQVNQQKKRWSRLAAMLLSLLIPGLGQLYKGQFFNGLLWFILTIIGYVAFIVPGIILHVCCIIGAGTGDPYK